MTKKRYNRKVLISCGSNKGGEFLTFQKSKIYSNDFVIYAFEPEERCFSYIEETQKIVPNITHIKKGVSTDNGTATFNVGGLTVSGSLRADKVWGLSGKTITIETLDFCEWLKENINKKDYVILTMDIEGSEYEVLNKMLVTNTIELVDKIYVEFHGDKLKEDTKNVETKIKEELKSRFGDNFFDRYVEGNPDMFHKAYPNLDKNMFNNIGTIE